MVNSASEFVETVHTLNGIIGSLSNRDEVEEVQKLSRFAVIPLPHSQSQFIACFQVPSDLLGEAAARRMLRLDYSHCNIASLDPKVVKRPPTTLYIYSVTNLFEVNVALNHFDNELTTQFDKTQKLRIRHTMSIMVKPGNQPTDPVFLALSVQMPLVPVNQLTK